MDEIELGFRSGELKDFPFIFDSWGSSYHQGSNGRHLLQEEFHSFHRPTRERIINDSKTRIKICYPKPDYWIIMGWVCYQALRENMLIHYIYVKNAFRSHGIARELIKEVGCPSDILVFISHRTFKAAKLMEEHPDQFKNYTYMPHLV